MTLTHLFLCSRIFSAGSVSTPGSGTQDRISDLASSLANWMNDREPGTTFSVQVIVWPPALEL